MPSITILTNHNYADRLEKLAASLALPMLDNTKQSAFSLLIDDGILKLQDNSLDSKPIFVDICNKENLHRLRSANLKQEPLLKACKFPLGSTIIDLTMGLGQDSLLLAARGFKVIALEQSPIIFALMQDAIIRAQNSNEEHFIHSILSRLTIIQTNATDFLQHNLKIQTENNHITGLYLDPMFPVRKKAALVKKEMQVLHNLLYNNSTEIDNQNLFLAAQKTKLKIVLKRPRNSPFILDIPAKHSYKYQSCRFDIY